MTDTQTAPEIAQLTDHVAALTAAVERIGGYAAEEEWGWVACDGDGIWAKLKPREGAEPLKIECRTDLLIGEVEAIPIEAGTQMRDVWRAIAPHIRAWNVKALNTETGTWEGVPPPRVMGPDAFKYVKPLAAEWMAFVIKFARLRDIAHPKDDTPSSPTPKPPNANASASSAPAKRSPKNRTATTSPAGTT